jgi:quinol-cytochrome oxidoreductase complex cytochrome b subunit
MKQVLKGFIVVCLVVAVIFGAIYLMGYSHTSGEVTTPAQMDWEHYFQDIMKQVTGPGKATPYRYSQ